MASSSSKTLMDLSKQPAAKRLKQVSSTDNFISSALSSSSSRKDCDEDPKDVVSFTPEQKSRMEFNRSLAKARRNLKLCSDKISKLNANGEGGGYVKLQELLIEETWLEALPGEFEKPYAGNLCKFVEKEISGGVPIYPPLHLIFNALNTTSFDRIKAVIIGQDPYHGPGQAMGLSFSVPKGVKVPSSLMNIYKELKQDLGCSIPLHGNLEQWAVQGVLLLNAVLTGIIRQIHMQIKAGSNLQMLSSKQFLRRKKELFSFCGETMPKQKPG
ncbi:uracil-DNA glycosylase, mitochondrial isoform X2 [Solanum tuberosum]|uniref:uracil-DNA glycosylase, mitochondrial isoform X2 n=1 Tax=Solanum tuberosum TaxID=4113 RepID=UPI000739FFAB|nr:PREDICTED: uracil-DNA glycosylase, mitochondrial isoform X2 [Solanum tuberosum]